MSDTSLVFNAIGRDKGVNTMLARTASNVRVAHVAAAAGTVVLGTAMASAAAHAVALGSSALSAVGAVALLPAALGSLIGIVAAVKASTFGLGEAWKQTGLAAAVGGGTAAATAKRVAMATREVGAAQQSLADAQRDALAAQLMLTRARTDEAERLQDMAHAAAGAGLDEEAATRAVVRARERLNQARQSGDRDDIIDSELAYRQAQHTLEEVSDRLRDLTAEHERAGAAGVEGSDAVQSALRREEEMQRAVLAATQRLADAQAAVAEASRGAGGASDKAAEALAKLSPQGRDAVLMLRQLAPSWRAAGMASQQGTFEGAATHLQALSGIYLPTATTWLTRMGTAFGMTLRQTAGLAQTAGFAADVDTVLTNMWHTTRKLGGSLVHIVNAIMQFTTVGSTFLPGMADSASNIAVRFERWALAARESGRMHRWISGALSVLKDFWAIAVNVGASVKAIIVAGSDGGQTVASLVAGTAAMRAWLESAQGQEKVVAVLGTLRQIFTGLREVIPVVLGQAGALEDTFTVFGEVAKFAAGHADTLAALLPFLAAGFVISKTAQIGANIAMMVGIPLRAIELTQSWGMRGALQANTAAMVAHTAARNAGTASTVAGAVATTAGDVATKRGLASMAAMKVATLAGAMATGIATAAQWAWNIAVSIGLLPILAIIAGIALFVAAVILVIMFHKEIPVWLGKAWDWGKEKISAFGSWIANDLAPALLYWLTWPHRKALEGIQWVWARVTEGATFARDWVIDKLVALVGFVTSLPGRMRTAAANLFDGLKESFRNAINWMITKWNNFSLTLGGGEVLGMGIPSVTLHTPNLPFLAQGGRATRAGLAVVGDDGAEVVKLAAGDTVYPMDRVGSGTQTVRVVIELRGGDSRFKAFFRDLLRSNPDLLVVS